MFSNIKVTVSTDQPKIQYVVGSDTDVILLEPIEFNITIGKETIQFTIHAGFKSDGASIPAKAYSILSLHPLHQDVIIAALCHDFIFRTNTINISFKNANGIYYKLCNCSKWKRVVMYYSIKFFGKANYVKRIEPNKP